jgi:sugar fermentation stimulation protein A
VLRVPRASQVKVQRLGRCAFRPGWYVYTGSAKRNLEARLARHLRRQKRLHWHIDYLLDKAAVREVWVWPWDVGAECRTNRLIHRMATADYPCRGFGASDCRCRAHLVSFPSQPATPESRPPFRYWVRGTRLIPLEG